MSDTPKPDHGLAESNARELLEKSGTNDRFSWMPENLARAYLAKQAECERLRDIVKTIRRAVGGESELRRLLAGLGPSEPLASTPEGTPK